MQSIGKATGGGSVIFGIFMMIFAIGAHFSGEEASQTDQRRIAIGIVILLGLGLIYGGVDARTKVAKTTRAPAPQTVQVVQTADVPPPPPDAVFPLAANHADARYNLTSACALSAGSRPIRAARHSLEKAIEG